MKENRSYSYKIILLTSLIDKFLNNTISTEELAELRDWLGEQKHKIEFEAYFRDQVDVNTALQEIDFDRAYKAISRGIHKPRTLFKKIYVHWYRFAAIFVGAIGLVFGAYFLNTSSNDANAPIETPAQITLELEDGTLKFLNESASGIITDAEGKKIVNHDQNTLLYNDEDENVADGERLTYNLLTVPYGKKFQVVLSDGSRIFLNSGSKLRYPTKFIKGMPRDVFLDGEGYFIVEKDTVRPFTVTTDEMNVRVLGTKFNISSYKNENNTATVLVEGSVEVYNTSVESEENRTRIAPGQRAVLESGILTVNRVNLQKHIAWTEGKLYFVNDGFDLILKELERNFNVTINNTYTVLNAESLTGTFETETLEQILDAFRAYKAFDYVIEENNITITKPKQ